MNSTPLKFEILHQCSTTKARVGRIFFGRNHTGKGPVETPVFMPVGTQGTLKGLTPEQLQQLNCRLILGNTYHLGHRPVNSKFSFFFLNFHLISILHYLINSFIRIIF